VSEWIELSKYRPVSGQAILVSGKTSVYNSAGKRAFVAAGVYRTDKYPPIGFVLEGCEWEFDFEEEEITHWMPLPNPPCDMADSASTCTTMAQVLAAESNPNGGDGI
jgi:hypothetical protein